VLREGAAGNESRQMGIGLLMLGDTPVQTMVERPRLAEAVGYDTVWLADERFYREVYSCLTHFAGNTSKVLLGPCVTDPFSRHPALTAIAIANARRGFGRAGGSLVSALGFPDSPSSGSIVAGRRVRSTRRLRLSGRCCTAERGLSGCKRRS
jgi:hypothetical protein